MGHDRVWFKSRLGIAPTETLREKSPFDETILGEDVYQIPDAALDEHYQHKGILLGTTRFRFFAGAPLIAPNGTAIGCLAILSETPRRLTDEEAHALRTLANQILARLELNARVRLMESESRVRHLLDVAHASATDAANDAVGARDDLADRERWFRHLVAARFVRRSIEMSR